jgi:nucleoside-diphosphate-sugar epimerase
MILLTGATGFIGRHLLDGLIRKYGSKKIVAYTRSPIAEVECILHSGFEIESFDFSAMGLDSIEMVVHAGAFTPKDKTESNNFELADLNVFVTNCLLNAKLPNLKRFVYLSTLDVYAPAELIDENTLLSPSTAYARSKMRCEDLVVEWAKKTGNIGQVLRIGHVYGPGEDLYRKVIPETMRRLRDGQMLQMFGTGKQKRAFIYVKDVCSAILATLDLEQDIGPINIAGSHQISMEDLIGLIVDLSGVQPKIEMVPSADDQSMVFNTTKLKKYLLRDEMPLRNGLRMEWEHMIGAGNENNY